MSNGNGEAVSVSILPNTSGSPQGKLADAEVVFGAECGPFNGMRLLGFAVWERRDGGHNVTFPARPFSANGERRTEDIITNASTLWREGTLKQRKRLQRLLSPEGLKWELRAFRTRLRACLSTG